MSIVAIQCFIKFPGVGNLDSISVASFDPSEWKFLCDLLDFDTRIRKSKLLLKHLPVEIESMRLLEIKTELNDLYMSLKDEDHAKFPPILLVIDQVLQQNNTSLLISEEHA